MKRLTIGILILSGALAPAGEIADLHGPKGASRSGDSSRDEAAASNHGVTEMGIERSMCFGSCPVYTFIAKSDGTFRYKGEKFVERIGEFTGRISPNDFNRLAHFIQTSGYMQLPDAYTRRVTDMPTTYTMVVMNGERKTVSNYAHAGPNNLWAIEQLIDHLMAAAQWSGSQRPSKPAKSR